ncbi:MAG: NAD(P)H-dependent oxidoreductase subunit E, partial [Pseudomonadota bacterium]
MNDMSTPGGNSNSGGDGPKRSIHPGAGRRQALSHPKGRVLASGEREAVEKLIGPGPYERALLIEYLHLIQDHEGCLPAGYLHGLSECLSIPMAEVFEVATFYAHFDVVPDGAEKPARTTIRVCDSLSCMLAGAEDLISALQTKAPSDVRVVRAPCIGSCNTAPAAHVGHRHIDHATAERVLGLASSGIVETEIPDYQDFYGYASDGGYKTLKSCLSGERTVDDVITTLSDGGLRGLGGAGFPTGRKWGFVRAEKGPRLMAVNGDEGEPGTFKDRHYLETRPHQFLEGMLIAAWAVEAEEVFIYMR